MVWFPSGGGPAGRTVAGHLGAVPRAGGHVPRDVRLGGSRGQSVSWPGTGRATDGRGDAAEIHGPALGQQPGELELAAGADTGSLLDAVAYGDLTAD